MGRAMKTIENRLVEPEIWPPDGMPKAWVGYIEKMSPLRCPACKAPIVRAACACHGNGAFISVSKGVANG